MTYDVIIVGGGIQGVATAYELAKRGAGKILLLEKTILTGSLISLPLLLQQNNTSLLKLRR